MPMWGKGVYGSKAESHADNDNWLPLGNSGSSVMQWKLLNCSAEES